MVSLAFNVKFIQEKNLDLYYKDQGELVNFLLIVQVLIQHFS